MSLKLVSDEPQQNPELIEQIRSFQIPLRGSLSALMDRIGDARFVLLGECAPGISDSTIWRMLISRRLIEEFGFSFIALDADWSSTYQANRYVKGYSGAANNARSALSGFRSWPSWIYTNKECLQLLEWLRAYNRSSSRSGSVGIYGLDIYGLWDTLKTLHSDLRGESGKSYFQEIFHCFQPLGTEAIPALRSQSLWPDRIEALIPHLLQDLHERSLITEGDGIETHFQAEQHALIMKNAEAYFRTFLLGRSNSWNLRDNSMMDTLDRLMALHGPDAKVIVWLDNTQLGDARFTALADAGEINLGQLHRERHGAEDVVLVGFSSYSGTVLASSDWGSPAEALPMPEAREGSWEAVLHAASAEDKLLIFDRAPKTEEMHQMRGQRGIGAIYRPEFDARDYYVPTILSERYDALIYIDEVQAIHPLLTSKRPYVEGGIEEDVSPAP